MRAQHQILDQEVLVVVRPVRMAPTQPWPLLRLCCAGQGLRGTKCPGQSSSPRSGSRPAPPPRRAGPHRWSALRPRAPRGPALPDRSGPVPFSMPLGSSLGRPFTPHLSSGTALVGHSVQTPDQQPKGRDTRVRRSMPYDPDEPLPRSVVERSTGMPPARARRVCSTRAVFLAPLPATPAHGRSNPPAAAPRPRSAPAPPARAARGWPAGCRAGWAA
jgi:hypothetical protein